MEKNNNILNRKYLLLDTSVIVAYYLPESSTKTTVDRIKAIIDAVKNKELDCILLIPNICIPEVTSTFSKYAFSRWNPKVKKNLPKGLSANKFKQIKTKFHYHLHNGILLNQYELNRYHILYSDMVSAIDHYYQVQKAVRSPMGSIDHLIISMGIYLQKLLGKNNFAILTDEDRMHQITEKRAGRLLPESTIKKLQLSSQQKYLNIKINNDLFPRVINIRKYKITDLDSFFGLKLFSN